jgi:hypothetical protein
MEYANRTLNLPRNLSQIPLGSRRGFRICRVERTVHFLLKRLTREERQEAISNSLAIWDVVLSAIERLSLMGSKAGEL